MIKRILLTLFILLFSSVVYSAQTTVNTASDSFETAWDRQQAMNTELYTFDATIDTEAEIKALFNLEDADIVTLITGQIGATHDTAAELNALFESELDNSAGLLAALSNETGTGVAVFNNSPTLVTPALGTPSALVLTNATGFPYTGLANGTDGQLITWGADATPAVVATGTATHVLTSNGAGAAPTFQAATGGVADDSFLEVKLDSTNAATDNYILSYDSASGGFTWVAPGSGSGDLLADGTVPLTANWDVGAYTITGTRFISDIAIGTSPFAVTSTTVCTNLNADLLDGESASAFEDADAAIVKSDENETITGNWTFSGTTTLPASSVDSDAYTNGSIDAEHLAADIIDETKIADNGIDSEHYNDASIDNAHLADDAVDSDEIADGAVDLAHLSAGAKFQSYAVASLSDTSTPSVLTTAETTNKCISNYKATGADHVFTMPAAHAAGNIIFSIGDEFQIDIEPNTSDLFYLNGTAMAADEHIQNTADTLGQRIVGYCVNINGTLRWMFYSSDSDFVEETP